MIDIIKLYQDGQRDFSHADLSGASLSGANLSASTMCLLANWDEVSDDLCIELMRYDAANHEDPEEFIRWKENGKCPYKNKKYQRAAIFRQKKELYTPGPSLRPFDLMVRIIQEKCKDSDYHKKGNENESQR
jgi:hypothetical protein